MSKEFWFSIIASIIAIIISIIAARASIWANYLTAKQMDKSDRPWLRIYDETIEDSKQQDEYRINGTLQNISGGPALKISFKIGINGFISELEQGNFALLPNETFKLKSHRIKGPKLKENDIVSWIFEFEDINQKKYRIKQEKLLRPIGLKELNYSAEEL